MWLIQNAVLIRFPDDVPVPPNSHVIEVPHDFDPRDYRIESGALVKVERVPRESPQKFTADEVRQIKAAIAANELSPKRRKEER